MDFIFSIPAAPVAFVFTPPQENPAAFIFSIPNTLIEIIESGDVLIKDQNGNTIATVAAPGEYEVEVLEEIVDTIDSNTITIIVPLV